MPKNKLFRNYISILLSCCLLITSCMSGKKQFYIQNPKFSSEKVVEVENRPPTYRIQVDDVLLINIKDMKGEPLGEFTFSPSENRVIMLNANNAEANLYINGYTVDIAGFINVPTLGRIEVRGLTVEEIEDKLKKLLEDYIKNPIVSVKLGGYKISVLGEVRNPGRYYLFNNRISIFDALAMSGDLKEYADRKNIKLIRETEKGTATILVDLTKGDLLESPYYYLKPNDILIVSPSKTQLRRANFPVITTAFAAISSLIVILRFFDVRP
ncbi:protein involved in gliding motility EpsA [Thermoflexibacter ruber]|uniref:Protein involved in gliding motility EpsA n=2 Tax=Thermoflexibacter ruber TaxID=1003 RepID=A0A1I2JT01_9BACT|nr:protein involved in gliding motility EpsA [Thermoflexibacter ruber]